MNFLSNEEKEKWIQDYVERETAGARKRGEDAEAAFQQEQDNMKHADIGGLTSTEPKPSCVMGTITKMVQQHMERFQQKQMKHGELTQPGWDDAADCFL
jgi:hypothetical protein